MRRKKPNGLTVLTVRVHPADRAQLVAMAAERHVTLSELTRQLLPAVLETHSGAGNINQDTPRAAAA